MQRLYMMIPLMFLGFLCGNLCAAAAPAPGAPSPPAGVFGPGTAAARPLSANIRPASFSDVPAEIMFDFADSRGEFSKYIFTVVDAPYPLEEGYKLAKDANFQAIGMIHFLRRPELSEAKARLLSKYGLEGVIYWELEAENYLPEGELKQRIDQLVNRIKELTKKYPNLKIKTFLFGNEPNLPQRVHWKGTTPQFFQNYATFVRYLKSKNKNFVVGGPGFAPESIFGGRPNSWPEMFIKYLHENHVPIDFIAFHSYSTEVKTAITDVMSYYKNLLQRYPVKSPIFGTPKLANNEYDLIGHAIGDGKYFREMDSTWRGAHNIMSLMAMVHGGVWLASEFCGPFRITDPRGQDIDFLWVRKDGTIKPVYYAHKAFNALAHTIQIAQQGSNFETFGALGGKSQDGKRVTIVVANYDEYGYRHFYPQPGKGPPRQSVNSKIYRRYKINLRNLPWTSQDKIKVERYLVDDRHNLSLIESSHMAGGRELSLERATDTPEVQLIRLIKP
jgi:hypothetical protein